MSVRKGFGYFAGAVIIIVGFASFVTPIGVGHMFGLDVNQQHPRGWPTLSAVLGGLYLMVGVMFIYGLMDHAKRLDLVRWGSYIWTAVALGRTITTIRIALISPLNLIFVAMDIALATAMLFAAFSPILPKIKRPTKIATGPLPTVEGEVVSAATVAGAAQATSVNPVPTNPVGPTPTNAPQSTQ